MRALRTFLLSSVMLCAAPLLADTINFDNIDASAGDVPLALYQGYTFTNFSAYTTTPGFPGFNNGIVSGPNAAYSSDFGSIVSSMPFDFTGGSFGSGYYNNLTITIEGLLNGLVVNSQTITVGTGGAQAFTFAFLGIDTLRFTTGITAATTDPYACGAVGCSYFTLDDAFLTKNGSPSTPPVAVTPEPSSFVLLTFGLLAMVPAWRSRFSH